MGDKIGGGSVSIDFQGGVELRGDLSRMADMLRTSGGNGSRACNWVLKSAAQPILDQMIQNANTDPKRRSGKLVNSIRVGNVVRRHGGGYRVTIGVHRKDGGAEYANPVEHGHGGPHPAPPHPFVRPAFDAKQEEAFARMKELLIQALDSRGLL